MGENQENFKAEAVEHANVLKDWHAGPIERETGSIETAILVASEKLQDMMYSGDPDKLAALKEAVWEVAGRNSQTAVALLTDITGRSWTDLEIDDFAFLGIEKLLEKANYFHLNNPLTANLPTANEFRGVVEINKQGANKAPLFEIFIQASPWSRFARTVFHEENLLDTSVDFASQIKARLATMKVEYPEWFPE